MSTKSLIENKATTDELTMNAEEILLNLKIISQIKENEKLATMNDQLSIDQSRFQFVSRIYYGNNRENTIKQIDLIISNALSMTDKTLQQALSNETNNIDKENVNILMEEPSSILHRFLIQMSCAIKGLENLKVTYKEDVSILSKLDLICEKINMRIEKINKVLTININ